MNMPNQFHNPAALGPTNGWSHAVSHGPGKTVYISGQVAVKDGDVVGKGDIKAQTRQAFENIKIALTSAGATFNDVVKMSIFVVGLKADYIPQIREIRAQFVNMNNPPASTLVGVTALVGPDWMIEIEAIAVVGG